MTADELAIEDEITAIRLDWLDAEARLVELLPSAIPTPAGRDAADPQELTAALEQAEQAHRAYLSAVRKWAGLTTQGP